MVLSRSVVCKIILAFLVLPVSLISFIPQARAVDVKNCKDHPLFTRMNNMHIENCKISEFDKFDFKTGSKTVESIEGKRFEIRYKIDAGNTAPSPVAIIRNHQQAIANIGGKMLVELVKQ